MAVEVGMRSKPRRQAAAAATTAIARSVLRENDDLHSYAESKDRLPGLRDDERQDGLQNDDDLDKNEPVAGGSRGRVFRDFRKRRIAKRLEDLERTNNHDVPNTLFSLPPTSTHVAIPSSTISAGQLGSTSKRAGRAQQQQQQQQAALLLQQIQQEEATKKSKGGLARSKGKSANVKALLIYRKTLKEYIQESGSDIPYLHATVKRGRYPARKLCSSCGYFGAYACQKCGDWSCSKRCIEVHEKDGRCDLAA